jgi:glycosyltransferase involved in cell wall biosynthesis
VVAAYFAAKWIKKAGIHTVGVSHSDDPFYHAIQKEFIDGKKDFRLSGMVCVSNELEKQLKASKFSSDINIKRIPYGVNIPEVITSRRGKTLKVVYVGRLAEEQKRISEVAKAFCEIVKQVPNTQALIYGDGPDRAHVEDILVNEAKDLPVTLEGSIPANKVQEMLLDAHVIVLLSDFEGLPIAVLEAMACGVVPVCLEMKSGISEQIIQGVTGFVVKDRKEDFISVIKKLENNYALWKSVSLNAKDYIKQHFTMVQCHDLWQRYFEGFSSDEPGPIIILDKIKLPKVNIHLARADRRKPSQIKQICEYFIFKFLKARMFFGKLIFFY